MFFCKINFRNSFLGMTFSLLHWMMFSQPFVCLHLLLERSMSKWYEWIVRNRSSAGASAILKAIAELNSAYLRLESSEENPDALNDGQVLFAAMSSD